MSSTATWNDFKELVRSRTEIVALIGQTVALQPIRGGKEFVGLCPFHPDSNPSMRVYQDRQSFRCWACAEGGDCFDFVMKRESVPFPEALEILATRAGLELPRAANRNSGTEVGAGVGKPKLYEALGWVEGLCHDYLMKAPDAAMARKYLAERGLTEETIQRFRLGYHPPHRQWILQQANGKFTKEQLLAAKIIKASETSGYQDEFLFIDRVMFPIHDAQGKTVAFGGRILPGATNTKIGKYINSSESVVFTKSKIIYGLDVARDAIVKSDIAILMEGYMDCIMAHQAGIANCVATMGTALTEQQVASLKRLARTVVMVYDSDDAGQNATEKSLSRFLGQELDLRILTLTGAKDPAEVIQEGRAEWFCEQAAKAPEAWEFKFRRVIERYGTQTVDSAHRVLEEMLELLCEVPAYLGDNPVGRWQMREDILLGRLSQRLGLPELNVRERLRQLRQDRKRKTENSIRGTPQISVPSAQTNLSTQINRLIRQPSKDDMIDLELLQIVIMYPENLTSIRMRIGDNELKSPELTQLWRLCLDLAEEGVPVSYDLILTRLEDSSLKSLVVWLAENARQKNVTPELLNHTLGAVERRRDQRKLSASQEGLDATRDGHAIESVDSKMLLAQLTERHRRRNERHNHSE